MEKPEKDAEIFKIGYVRVSKEDQDLIQQIDLMRTKGVPVELIFQDDATSGSIAPEKRHGFQRMLKHLHAAAAKGIPRELLTFDIGRLGRNTTESLEHILAIEKGGSVRVIFLANSHKFLNEVDPLIRPILIVAMSLSADIERRQISERTRLGLERVRKYGSESGKPIGRPKVVVDWEKVEEIRLKGLSYNAARKILGYRPTSFWQQYKEYQSMKVKVAESKGGER